VPGCVRMNPEARSAALLPGLFVVGGGAAIAVPLLGVLVLLAFAGATGVPLGGGEAQTYPAPSAGLGDIPPLYLSLYMGAARRYGLDWAVLAAVGEVECDHGRDPDPSCTHAGAVNSAGAGGPAQFLAGTWRVFGVDGDHDGVADRWDPTDAIFSMASYLRASGAPEDYRRALFAYNRSWSYVAEVEHWAAVYRADAQADPQTSPPTSGGSRAVLAPGDGHTALVPADAPAAVQAMVVAGNELQDLPYGTAGHPDPRGASSEDCSSTLNYVLYRSGVRPVGEIVHENPLAQDYTRWGVPGPGRWVTIYATAAPVAHVFVVIAGLRLDTSHDGTDVGPNRLQGGPRWRVLDRIPTWAHWTVRHPPGL
jgi:transglycosylase-like protein with SLT domain